MNRSDAIAKRFDIKYKVVGVEVGVYKGNLSRALLNKLPNLFLHMVDRWAEYSPIEKQGNFNSTMSTRAQESFNAAYKKAEKVHKKNIERSNIIKQSSLSASKKFSNNTLDFVFLDGDHSYDAVSSDIEAWMPKIKKGGFICGHDYNREPVSRAVNEMFSDFEIDIDDTWFFKIK